MIKLQHGEYIALEHLESIYKSCDLVGNLCVYASAEAKQPLGIIFPHEHNLKRTLSSDASLHDLCNDKAAKEKVLQEVNAVGKKNGLKQVELLCAVILTPEEWTPENGLLTAAHKIQRSKITNAFKDPINVSCTRYVWYTPLILSFFLVLGCLPKSEVNIVRSTEAWRCRNSTFMFHVISVMS